jgi:malate/L-lactate dehydrogenase
VKIPFEVVESTIKKALLNAGLDEEKASICSKIHTESSADGVESHGCNRVPRFVEYIQKGWVNPRGEATLVSAKGIAENYDGNLGAGITNALFCADRAVSLAKEHGLGLVTIKNTTHWMRGGTYAWQMAENDMIGICFIATESCMPMWGSDEIGVGNNPFCMAVPRENGEIILDMAMSQYAYGKIGVYRLAGKMLPYPGGFDDEGNLTSDPAAIEKSNRIMPTGYWKGTSMAIVLDLLAAALANGKTGADLDDEKRGCCTGCCQVFIAIDPYLFGVKEEIQAMWDKRVLRADSSHPIDKNRPVKCPGENTKERRKLSKIEGINVDERIWQQIVDISNGNMDIVDIS